MLDPQTTRRWKTSRNLESVAIASSNHVCYRILRNCSRSRSNKRSQYGVAVNEL